MATNLQREADAPGPAANSAEEGPNFSSIIEAVEGDRFDSGLKAGFRSLIKNFQRLHEEINKLESEFGKKEAQVQKVTEELESEKAQKDAQVQKVTKLESEKAQKEAQVQKVMEENVTLHAMLDKKEAQLQAMNEQCKFMALKLNPNDVVM